MSEFVYILRADGKCNKCKDEYLLVEKCKTEIGLNGIVASINKRDGLLEAGFYCERCKKLDSVYISGKMKIEKEENLVEV